MWKVAPIPKRTEIQKEKKSHVLVVTCQMPPVTCHMLLTPKVRATNHPPSNWASFQRLQPPPPKKKEKNCQSMEMLAVRSPRVSKCNGHMVVCPRQILLTLRTILDLYLSGNSQGHKIILCKTLL